MSCHVGLSRTVPPQDRPKLVGVDVWSCTDVSSGADASGADVWSVSDVWFDVGVWSGVSGVDV